MGVLAKYDIFSGKFDDGNVLWLEAADGLDNAYERMKQLAAKHRGPYFVFCPHTRRVLAQIDTTATKYHQTNRGCA